MVSLGSWPALQLLPGEPPSALLTVERGIWGKVHGARTEYRWMARSAALGQGVSRLEELFALGPEDEPTRAAFWRALPDRYLAVSAYPSRAQDRTGRRGFCEKQVLEWRPATALPAAAVALLLLPEAERYDDSIWWSQAPRLAAAPELSLAIEESALPRVELSAQALEEALRQGWNELMAALSSLTDAEPQLGAFYSSLLAARDRAPTTEGEIAWLEGLEQPLSARALACLLLPLPRFLADRLSLAGWLFSTAASPALLAKNWQVVVHPPGVARSAPRPPTAHGMLLAQALLRGKPPSSRPASPISSPPPSPRPQQQQSPATALPGPPDAVLTLSAPEPTAPPLLWEIYHFARAENRRWLAPEVLKQNVANEPERLHESAHRDLLLSWVRQVSEQRPPHADTEQWAVKVDLLRALTLALFPSPETLHLLADFPSGIVPPLLYAPIFQASAEMLHERLGEEGYRWCEEASHRQGGGRWETW